MILGKRIYDALAHALGEIHHDLVLADLVGEHGDVHYEDITGLGKGDFPHMPVARKNRAWQICQLIRPGQVALCDQGHLPWEFRDGAMHLVQEGRCPICGTGWVEMAGFETVYDWIRGADVPADQVDNTDFGVPVPLTGIKACEPLASLLKTQGVEVGLWLNYYANRNCGGDPFQALDQTVRGLPNHITMSGRLRLLVEEAGGYMGARLQPGGQGNAAVAVSPSPTAGDVTDDDLRAVIDTAVELGAGEPGVRDLLLAWTGMKHVLPRKSTPAAQVRSDVVELFRAGKLSPWLREARDMYKWRGSLSIRIFRDVAERLKEDR